MALILRGTTRCMICDGVLKTDDDIGGTPAFIADRSDRFYQFSDAGFRRSCYETWEHRTTFDAKIAAALERAKRDMRSLDAL